jgi:threonine synthase
MRGPYLSVHHRELLLKHLHSLLSIINCQYKFTLSKPPHVIPISDSFETYDGPDEKSVADAIVSKTSERSPKLVSLINETNGYGWTATNEEINTAKELVQKHTGLDISNNSALSVVGAMQAVYRDWQIDGSVICLICGE